MKTTIYLFPHHDDEIFVIPKIRQDVSAGRNIRIYFLTSSIIRAEESRKFLVRLGVDQRNIVILGASYGCEDNFVIKSIASVFNKIKEELRNVTSEYEFVCTAYEGGHQDHDANSLLARALAKTFNGSIVEYFLYHGYKTQGRLYHVADALAGGEVIDIKYSWADVKNLFMAPLFYKSQIKAILGLWPFLLIKALVKPLKLRKVSAPYFRSLHHERIPMYERWNRMTHRQFLVFADEHLFLKD
jgi:hypothetical protein